MVGKDLVGLGWEVMGCVGKGMGWEWMGRIGFNRVWLCWCWWGREGMGKEGLARFGGGLGWSWIGYKGSGWRRRQVKLE